VCVWVVSVGPFGGFHCFNRYVEWHASAASLCSGCNGAEKWLRVTALCLCPLSTVARGDHFYNDKKQYDWVCFYCDHILWDQWWENNRNNILNPSEHSIIYEEEQQ